MALSDAQVDRYSRQIVLPEIGGRGQERLLAATVCLRGGGPLLDTAARYLAGAGIGALRLDDPRLVAVLRALNDDVDVHAGGVDGATAVIATGLDVDALAACSAAARAGGAPLIAAGLSGSGGWLLQGNGCPACAAHAAAERTPYRAALAPVAAGVLGALAALAVLRRVLGRAVDGAPLAWLDVRDASLTAWAPACRPGCGGC